MVSPVLVLLPLLVAPLCASPLVSRLTMLVVMCGVSLSPVGAQGGRQQQQQQWSEIGRRGGGSKEGRESVNQGARVLMHRQAHTNATTARGDEHTWTRRVGYTNASLRRGVHSGRGGPSTLRRTLLALCFTPLSSSLHPAALLLTHDGWSVECLPLTKTQKTLPRGTKKREEKWMTFVQKKEGQQVGAGRKWRQSDEPGLLASLLLATYHFLPPFPPRPPPPPPLRFDSPAPSVDRVANAGISA